MNTNLYKAVPKNEVENTSKKTDYRLDIDGIRAIAVTSVVLYHANIPFITSGFVGVDIFFVISGFLIGGILHRETKEGFSFSKFYARRAKRILPALIVVVFTSIFGGALLMSPLEFVRFCESAISTLLGVSNIRFWLSLNYFTPDAELDPLLMTWSLGVEEQFYIIFPFILMAMRKSNDKLRVSVIAAFAILSFLCSLFLTTNYPTAAFYLLPPRAWELGLGAILSIVMPKMKVATIYLECISIFGFFAIVISLGLYNTLTPFPGTAVILPVIGTLCVLLTPNCFINKNILSAKPMVFIGLISYSWYLWHWPILAFIRLCSISAPSMYVMILGAILSFLIAIVSWKYIERPFRQSPAPDFVVLRRYGMVLFIAMIVPSIAVGAKGLPNRFSSKVVQVDEAVNRTRHFDCLIDSGDSPNLATSCVNIHKNSENIAIIGDSHAAALAPVLKDLSEKSGQGYAILTKASCRPLPDIRIIKKNNPRFSSDCAKFTEIAYRLVENDEAIKTVVLAGLWDGPIKDPNEQYAGIKDVPRIDNIALIGNAFKSAVRRLQNHGKNVIVVKDNPYWDFDPAQALRIRLIPLRSLAQSYVDVDTPQSDFGKVRGRISKIDNIIDSLSDIGVKIIDASDFSCFKNSCKYSDKGASYFSDRSHLSNFGAEKVLSGRGGIITDN